MKITFLVSFYNATENVSVTQVSEMPLTYSLYELSMSQIIQGLICKPNSCNLSDMGNLQLFGRGKRQINKGTEKSSIF